MPAPTAQLPGAPSTSSNTDRTDTTGDAAADDAASRRILIVDDNRAIHGDFRKILAPASLTTATIDELESRLFGRTHGSAAVFTDYQIDSAYQGEEALAKVQHAVADGRRYSVAFVDVRMPPGWDGIETAVHLWEIDADVQVVICTAYSDYTWEETIQRLGTSDRFLILKKPFDHVEVRQLAGALTRKWALARRLEAHTRGLEETIRARTLAVEAAHDRLQRETAERYRMEAQLRRAQKLEALGRLAAGIAHEINNPLAFVLANLQFAHEGLKGVGPDGTVDAALSSEICSAIEEARVGGDRIKHIVKDLKAFAQPQDESMSVVDVRPTVDFALKITMGELKRVARPVVAFENAPPVWAIPGRLEQVLVNLLMNAAHAIPPGHTRENEVRVSVKRGPDETVVIEVADTGVGIAPAHLERIFDPFFTTKPVGVGTGLGLSICHSIVSAFGGTLTVDSVKGHGATFRITLPSAEGAPLTPPPQAITPAATPVPARILIVDEEPAVSKALRRVLVTHKVEAVTSGIEALARCQDRRFDLVLFDLRTSDVPGPEMFRRLGDIRHELARRLVFLSAGALDKKLHDWARDHDVPCLEKPFDAAAIGQVLADRVAAAPQPAITESSDESAVVRVSRTDDSTAKVVSLDPRHDPDDNQP